MNITKYYTLGSKSEKEGLTLMTALFDEEGNPLVGYDLTKMYKLTEITQEEYDAIKKEMREPPMGRLGLAGGLLNEEGFAAIEALNSRIFDEMKVMKEKDANMFYARAKRMEESGISTVQEEIQILKPSASVQMLVTGFELLNIIEPEDQAGVWAVLNASKADLLGDGQIPPNATLPNSTPIKEGDFGTASTEQGRAYLMTMFNLASSFEQELTNEDFIDLIISLRNQLIFIGSGVQSEAA